MANYPLVIESPSVCSDGTFAYAAGGRDAATFQSTDAFNRYDPLLDTWTPLANLPNAVGDARSVYAANTNSIYVFGGITDFDVGTVTNLVQIYDVAADTWTTGTPDARRAVFPRHCLLRSQRENLRRWRNRRHVLRNQHNLGV